VQNVEDTQLLKDINDGSHQAFGTLVKRYSKYFYSIAYRYVADRTTAEDITQQAFLKLWEFPYKYDASRGASFKTWFTQVIINLSIDHKRKNKHFFEDITEMEVAGDNKDAAADIYEKQMKAKLEVAINKLPKSQQTALNLGFYEDIPYEEVAKIMKTTTSAVKSLIMRAKENLKKGLKNV
jgi:RNA polymerase sigma-70 factor (ECF subfamily)